MSFIMKALKVSRTAEWAELAMRRKPTMGEAEIRALHEISQRFVGIAEGKGFVPDQETLQDLNLYLNGKMSIEEFHAYIQAKFSPQGN